MFDAQENINLKKTITEADSFNAGVVQILKNAGIPNKFLKGVGGEDVGTTEWKAAVENIAEAGAEFALETAIGGLLTAIGRPDWIPAAVGATKKITGHFAQMKTEANAAKLELLNPGQWLAINNGPPPEAELGFKGGQRRRLWGWWSADDGPPPDQISSGFYVGPASAAAYVTVFNFSASRRRITGLRTWPPRIHKKR